MSTARTHLDRPRQRFAGVLTAGALTIALLAGCGDEGQDGASPSQPGSTSEDTSTSEDATSTTEEPIMPTDDSGATKVPPSSVALPTGPVPSSILEQPQVRAAVADLAERLQVEESAVTVAGYFAVTWRDGSIGCPEPGMMYTQALVPGTQMVLQADDQLHAYHAASGQPFVYCANPQEPAAGSSTM